MAARVINVLQEELFRTLPLAVAVIVTFLHLLPHIVLEEAVHQIRLDGIGAV
jgi:hypothetical protein